MFLGIFTLRIRFATSAFVNMSAVDELSLLSIKANINSDILARNWSKETSFCTWTGITCGMELPHRVTAINLRNMGFEGTIAKEIGNLTFLRFVDMSNNSISGPIPAEVGNLRQLRVLNMESNQLTEGIPQSLGLLRKLQGLNLSNNNLIGVTPISLSGCVELRKLDLSHNNLSGYVPAGFWNWSQLEELSLSRNYLTGTVPASIGNLSNLEVFDISRNSFYGTVVSELGQLSSLRILNLQANNLSDEVPQAIFNISMLRFLSLRENNLSGSLPFSIDKGLPNIEHILIGNIERRFNLRANQFYGKIPNSVSNLSKLITLDLSDNSFTHIPIDLGSLHQLQKLNLQANQLMNNLSDPGQDFLSSLVACKNLKSIQISFNPITGVLPKSLGSSNLSTSLETLKAFSCRLSYPIPDEIGNLSNLWWLDLGYNHLTGAIPSTLGQLRSLRNLRICGNRFHGSISPVLCNFKHLYSLNVAINSLSGQLPSCFVNLSSLREVYMSDNEFNGSIASIPWFLKNVSNVKNLVALDLSRNQLSGEIPNTISQLENLVRLSLSKYGSQGLITTTVDIYSYGVLLMEMLSRRKPTDEMFSGELSLRRWISEAFPNSVLQILDNEMLDKVDEEARVVFRPFLTSAIELALECTADLPEERPSITYVLNRITDVLSSMRKILIQFKNLGMSISLIDSDQAGPSSRSDRTPKLWLQIEENDTQLAAVFSSTYRHMPPDMRKCFLYMASFPEDYEIHVSELIKLWVAKGFLECQNEHKSLEDKGKYVLKLLVQKGLVSVIRSDDKIISCRLHRVVWNFCQRQAKEDKFFLPVVD
ncbi:hypothetical protein SASPL_153353 [Salvia splendens]|uniref:Leucine-rich repeat-containing N-terminal plant-type domain-containing protein n=1 Tax=Salvia splendens TaxID=180675 RepID=A0A8X8Z1T4_SALSN|nr:hypothetical protein SASPL_153353 [Salvia splendens]